MLESWNVSKQWKQIAVVRGGTFTLGPVDDICKVPSFRVAAVNMFGSRWFKNATKIPANIPGKPRDVRVKSIDYDENSDEMVYTLKWSPPSGWDMKDISRVHNVTSTIQCSTDNWEKVYVMVDHFIRHKDDDGDYFTMDGRVSLNAIGCTVIFKIRASSRCNRMWIGPVEEFRLPIKCSDIMQYKGEYCTNPPVLRPGPVTRLKLTIIPLIHGMMGLVSWQPPIDKGSAGKVEAYHVFYGIVNLRSANPIKSFEGNPEHMLVRGDTFSVDIFLNITTLESYETVGVVVRAAGPGQIIETPFGKMIYADHMDSLHSKAGHLISDDDTMIVIASSDRQTEDRKSGIGVEIFWRRPNEETELNVVKYAIQWAKLHSNYTTTPRDDVFETSTVSRISTNGSENFISLGYLLPVTTYGFKILPLHEEIDPLDVPTEQWRNQTLHVFDTPKLDNVDGGESISTNVVTVPINYVTHGKSKGKTTWIIVTSVLITGIAISLLGILFYKKWHQKRVKSTNNVTPDERYRHYSQYGPGQSLGTSESRGGLNRVIDEWELPVSSVKIGPLLGSGAFGKVAKGRVSRAILEYRAAMNSLMQGGELSLDQADKCHLTVAIKMLHDHCEFQHKQDFLKEIDLMKRIGHHRNVVSMLGCCTGRDPIYLVVEHMANGDLLEYLKDIRHRLGTTNSLPDHYTNSNQALDTATDLLNFAKQIALGMEFLSNKGYVHRDLAARNVLVDSTRQCKIGDFGLTRYMYDDLVYVNRKGGRLPVKWMSIEAIFDQSFSTASDVWSFGIVMFEIITLGAAPYPTIPSRDLLKELQSGYRMARPDNCSEEVYQMMIQCWEKDPQLRPSFRTLSDWLQNMLNDRSGMEYIDMGINLNRDVYQVEDRAETDCTRYPLHRSKPSKTMMSGERRIVPSLATSDDSGYTTSKKSSVSSGESATATSFLTGRESEVGDFSGMITTSHGSIEDPEMNGAMMRSTEICEAGNSLKPKTVRKRVSFIETNELIEDDVFRDDEPSESDLLPHDKKMNLVHRVGDTGGNACKVSLCKAVSWNGIVLGTNTTLRRRHSHPSISNCIDGISCEAKQKKCFCQTKKTDNGTLRNLSWSHLSGCCYDNERVTHIRETLCFEKRQRFAKLKTRKRKMAVTTAPTLALSNDLYFHLDTTRFKQRPPAIKINRRIKPNTPKTQWTDDDFTPVWRDVTNGKNKSSSFEYSVTAEVHSPASRNPHETIPQLDCIPSSDSQQAVVQSFEKNDVEYEESPSFPDTNRGCQTDCTHYSDNINENNNVYQFDFGRSSPSQEKIMRFANIPNRDLSPLSNAELEVDSEEKLREISNPITTDLFNYKALQSSIRESFLKVQSRIRNDSGVPKSPDDVSVSPDSVTIFFPYESDLGVCFRPVDADDESNSRVMRSHSSEFYHGDRTGLPTTKLDVIGQRDRNIGHDRTGSQQRCGRPALASEKHPNALHQTKSRKKAATRSVSSEI